MASTNIISINQLIQMFRDFADAHQQLNDFGYGPTSEIGVNRQSKYPLLWITHRTPSDIQVTNKTQIPQLTLSFIIVDQINIQENYKNAMGVDGNNEQEILSDTFQIFQDLINYISVDMGQFGVKLMEDNISIEPLFDETQDKVTGWIGDINLQLKHSNCITPLGEIDFTIPGTSNISLRYLTCETLANCDTFTNAINSIEDNYVTGGTFNSLTSSIDFTGANSFTPFSVTGISSDNYYTTGATYTEPTVTFTRNDGGTYVLDLTSLVTRVKNNEDDISNITAQIILNKTNIDDNSTAIDTLGVIVDTKISCDDLSGCTTIMSIEEDLAVKGEEVALLQAQVAYLQSLRGYPPTYTTTERNSLTGITAGLMIFNSTVNKHQGWDGTVWNDFY